VDAPGVALTFAELDRRANQLARHLREIGIGGGRRVALLCDDATQAYVSMLAALKAGAAYVPLDPAFPADRIAYIVDDAEVGAVLSLSRLRDLAGDLDVPVVCVDAVPELAARESRPLAAAERGPLTDPLAYIIYTSGSTGRPKGVAVRHASICNFVRVAAEVYGIRPGDRMYQGMTIAFDFSVEEIWVPWTAGATLVPRPPGSPLLGVDLHAYLVEQRVTALCCVPTLLATLEEDVPDLRFLLVSGEACPHDLILRWHRSGRRFLNVYGPTEATVTATWTAVDPDSAVTIGVPLPTYSVVILDPDDSTRALPRGEVGEIGIAGVGLAVGYVNRADLTERAFVRDAFDIPGNPSRRIYRTGDLGRVTETGEIEYQGRIDLQVKIRGYRIELTEIESVLLQVPGVAQAVVDTYEPVPGTVELVGYYSLRTDATDPGADVIRAALRERLPPYMVPVYLEHLDVVPMTAQGKADRRNLPAPMARLATAGREHVAPDGPAETALAASLAETLGLPQVSATAHFFDDLGANSLLLAQFSARLRKETALSSISMREIYGNPSVRQLALVAQGPNAVAELSTTPAGTVVRASTVEYLIFGTLQLFAFLMVSYLAALLFGAGLVWSLAAPTTATVFGRSAVFLLGLFLAACLLPIMAKWLLIGRFTPREIRLWSLAHFRFWVVKTLIRASPLVFLGGPIYILYLRALGAKIGRGTTILSGIVPVTTDLIGIGAGTIIRRDSSFSGYRAVAGKIQLGRVTIGSNAFVGDKTTLDIDSSIGDGAQLGHTSSIHSGQHIPAGRRWHGVPAVPTTVDYRGIPSARCGSLRRFTYGALQLLGALVLAPLLGALAITATRLDAVSPTATGLLSDGHASLLAPSFYGWTAAITAALFVLGSLTGLAAMIVVPRLLTPLIHPGTTYPLYGVRWAAAQTITRLGNSSFFMTLFGDSSAVVYYLRALGYRMPQLEQTGSNFGTELKHDAALLTTIGSGTMVSDSLSVMNADFSATSFRMSKVSIGARCFIGNNIAYPVDARVGENVLLGSKVMVPLDGPVRENVGLLGSPCFTIPRTVVRDTRFDYLKDPAEIRRRLQRKNRHNALSMVLFLTVRWFQVYASTLLFTAAADLYYVTEAVGIAAALVAATIFNVLFTTLVERAATGFRALMPQYVSIYDPYFWRHERLWKLGATPAFSGTPFKNLQWRMLGVRIGRRVFDDGCFIPEKTLAAIGDDVVLNAGSLIQCHSLEDGTFKSDHTVIGTGTVIGVDSFVHYGVTVHEGAVIEADSFLMKGEEVGPFERWRGNPAAAGQEALMDATSRSA
jgi:non-ribosomal peptide synthetase-like protein